MLEELGIDGTECRSKVGIGRKLSVAIRCLGNTTSECATVLHEALFALVLLWQWFGARKNS